MSATIVERPNTSDKGADNPASSGEIANRARGRRHTHRDGRPIRQTNQLGIEATRFPSHDRTGIWNRLATVPERAG